MASNFQERKEEVGWHWPDAFFFTLQPTNGHKGWRVRKKTHASSPSTSGKTHEKTCPIQTRLETREALASGLVSPRLFYGASRKNKIKTGGWPCGAIDKRPLNKKYRKTKTRKKLIKFHYF